MKKRIDLVLELEEISALEELYKSGRKINKTISKSAIIGTLILNAKKTRLEAIKDAKRDYVRKINLLTEEENEIIAHRAKE